MIKQTKNINNLVQFRSIYKVEIKEAGTSSRAFCDEGDTLMSAGCSINATNMALYASEPVITENDSVYASC